MRNNAKNLRTPYERKQDNYQNKAEERVPTETVQNNTKTDVATKQRKTKPKNEGQRSPQKQIAKLD